MRKYLVSSTLLLLATLLSAQNYTPAIETIDNIVINEGMVYETTINASDQDINQLIENPTIVVLGSSTAAGTGATGGNDWVSLLENYLDTNITGHSLIRLARGAYTSYHFREDGFVPSLPDRPLPDTYRNITRAMTHDPDIIIVNLPSNDVAFNFDDQETFDNFSAIKAIGESGDARVFFSHNSTT